MLRSTPRSSTSAMLAPSGSQGVNLCICAYETKWQALSDMRLHRRYAEKHGPPAEELPRQDVGPRLPPGGWRAAGSSQLLVKMRASTAHGGPRQSDTPGLRRARMYQ